MHQTQDLEQADLGITINYQINLDRSERSSVLSKYSSANKYIIDARRKQGYNSTSKIRDPAKNPLRPGHLKRNSSLKYNNTYGKVVGCINNRELRYY